MKILNTLGYGGMVAVIGIAVVFIMLTLLIFFIWLMGQVFRKLDKRKAEKAAAAVAAIAPAPAPVVETPAVQEEIVENDAELIAVIAAAIAAFDDSGKRLVVRKVRRVSGWKDAARSEQIYHF
ncbi:MAG: OadG family protein [Aristaeellaceae bacterium]